IVHRHELVDWVHVLDNCAESIASHANVDDVFPAEHPVVRIHVPVRGHAGLGAIYRRGFAVDAFSSHCALDHAQRIESVRSALRRDCAVYSNAGGDGHCRHQIPPNARLAHSLFRTLSRTYGLVRPCESRAQPRPADHSVSSVFMLVMWARQPMSLPVLSGSDL